MAHRLTLVALLCLCGVSRAWAGAWGLGSFENDDALDWVSELERAPGPQFLVMTFQRIDPKSEYIEAPECSVALAAAEVVAAARGKPMAARGTPPIGLPESVTEWIARVQPKVSPELLAMARAAVTACRDGKNSELRDLWLEGDAKPWLADTANLRSRLK